MRLLGNTKKSVHHDKDGEDVPKLESIEVLLVNCNLVKKNYQQASKVFTFVPNKQFRQLITTVYDSLSMLNITSTEFGLLIKIARNLKYKIMLK